MSLRAPFSSKAIPNPLELRYNLATDAYWGDMVEQLNLAWQADLKGRADKAALHYRAGNYYTYLFNYGLIIANYIIRETKGDCSTTNMENVMANVECLFKLSCVEKNLPCISHKLGIDLVSLWNHFKVMFNINCLCESDGISEMIINYNDCSAFIVEADINYE